MLSELTLLQFRSHARAGLSFDGRPAAFYGANGAGKTNVLEAVSLLSPGRGLRRALGEEMMRRPGALGWKIRARVGLHEVESALLPGASRGVRIDDKAVAQVALARLLRVQWLVPAMDRLWIEGAEGRRRFLDRMTLSFEPGHAEVVLDYEKAMRERNRLLKDGVRDPAWYRALEARMAAAGAVISRNRQAALAAIAAAQAGAATAFPAAELSIGDGGPNTSEDLVLALAEGRRRDMAAGRTLSGPHRADLLARYAEKDIAAAQCSTGEQKALLLSLVLANARALPGLPVVLLLDEVAAHLDRARRAALYDELCALGAQVMMTGTGAELFDSLGARGQYWQVSEVAGTSQIEEVSR